MFACWVPLHRVLHAHERRISLITLRRAWSTTTSGARRPYQKRVCWRCAGAQAVGEVQQSGLAHGPIACLQVIEENRKGYEYVWFTNPLPLASIPTVSYMPCYPAM